MLRDFRLGWRMLLQEPAYSLVVIGGLAIGFAACFLLSGYVAFCLNYNSTVPDNDRVVAIKERINIFPRARFGLWSQLFLRDDALNSGLVSDATITKTIAGDKPLRVGSQLHRVSLTLVDPAFGAIFNVRARQGSLESALSHADGVALAASTAARLFGAGTALGQSLRFGDLTLQVRAVLPDPPPNSSMQYDALVGPRSSAWPERDQPLTRWGDGTVYLKLKPGASMTALTTLLHSAAENSPALKDAKQGPIGKSLNGANITDVRLTTLRDIYFDADLPANEEGYGRRTNVYGMAAGGVLILTLAAINYVNLATVRTLRRQREIGLRKLLGASTAQLVRQFLSEAVLIAILAALAGLVLAWLLLPIFSDLVNRPLNQIFTAPHIITAVGFSIVLGLAAGAYPAWLAQHEFPAAALSGRGNSETVTGLWLRRLLTVLQFGSAMALSAATLAVAWQTRYATHASPGFDPARLLLVRLPQDQGTTPAGAAFIEQVRRLPGVEAVSTITEAVGHDGSKQVDFIKTKDGSDVSIEAKYVSPNWFQVQGLRAVAGRSFNQDMNPRDDTDSDGVMVNAAGALALGFASPEQAVDQTVSHALRIIGIAPEIRFQGLHAQSKALLYRVRPADMVTIRSGMTHDEAYRAIEPVWRRHFPDAIMEVQTQQGALAARYADDARLMRILGITSATAIALAAFGIYVLSAYSVQRSQREIVMRKLHGASSGDIALRLAREYSALVAAGAVIGLPLAAVATRRYMAQFTEHAPVGGWTLAASLLLAMGVALLATARHTITALRMRPVLALRD